MTDEEMNALGETPEGEQGNEALLKALRAERAARKESDRKLALKDVLLKNAGSGLQEEDFEGLTPDKFEARAASLVQRFGQGSKTSTEEATNQEPTPEEEAFARMAATNEPGAPPAPRAEGILGPAESLALLKRDRAKFDQLHAAGKIDFGVKQVNREGSTFWEAK